jgi:predicted metal-dependent hydrolase
MMSVSEKNIKHKEFGKVKMIKSTRTRRISISARPFQPLRVTLPVFESFNRAERFLEEKERWIHRTLEKIRNLENQYTIFSEDSSFRTFDHELQIYRTDDDRVVVKLKDHKILVNIPVSSDIGSNEIQGMIRLGIQAAWRKEAKMYLPARLNKFSSLHRLPYNRVFIKNIKSRWGSCSQKNNINLSLYLMRLPDHLIDYILLHELAHTLHKDHSKRFWKTLERICPGARSLDRELRNYRIEIY